jgi:hypothetical protein
LLFFFFEGNMITDCLWAEVRTRRDLGHSVAEIAKYIKRSRCLVYNALANRVPPSQRVRKVAPSRPQEEVQRRRRRVRALAKKTVTITAKRKVQQRGRPRKDGTPRPFVYVTRKVMKCCYGSPALIARQLHVENITASRSTVRRDLVELGFKAFRRRPVCALTEGDKLRRWKFCKRLRTYPKAFFESIVFTDEKWFDANDSGQTFHWVDTNGKDNPRLRVMTREQSQAPAKVFVWGAIAVGWRCLVIVRVDWAKGGLKNDEYRTQCLSQLKKHPIRGRVLMQDGARIHWTSENKEYIKKNLKMPVVDEWPPHSADMNPIEHMWGIVQRAVSARGPWGVEELEEYVQDEFFKVSVEVVDRLVRSFERRVSAVAGVRGEHLV